MDKQKKTVTVMVLDEHRTETFVIAESRLRAIKPTIIGLSLATVVLLAALLALGWHHYRSYSQFAQQQQQTQALNQQIEDLKEARSAEVTAKLNQLAQSEKAVADLQNYLRQRGANVPAPKPAASSEPAARAIFCRRQTRPNSAKLLKICLKLPTTCRLAALRKAGFPPASAPGITRLAAKAASSTTAWIFAAM